MPPARPPPGWTRKHCAQYRTPTHRPPQCTSEQYRRSHPPELDCTPHDWRYHAGFTVIVGKMWPM
ncbi:hypothetical protein RSSE_c3207 [Ralstonia solanacearum]|nr:hypothetical protein RSSE_c3207 [Ralstonia solanacearum]